MDKYNVYMIDDSVEKQACFLQILDHAATLAKDFGLTERLEPGFGLNPEAARTASLKSADLWRALEDKSGIYLVDLDLGPAEDSFLDRFDTDGDPVYPEVAHCYQALRETHAANKLASEALEKYAIAVHILLYCKVKRKPALLVSTQPSAAVVAAVRRLELATTSTDDVFPQDLANVSKETVNHWALLILGLLDPLNRIKTLTGGWFAKKKGVGWHTFREDGLPHDTDGWRDMSIKDHRDYVKSIFTIFPERWWDDELKATALHECLKTAIGAHAQWMGNFHDKPLSLGGAYLFFLIALWHKHPALIDKFLVDDWTCFCTITRSKVMPLNFLGYQNPNCAERCVRTLYEFFLSVVSLKDGRTIGLSEFIPPKKGRPYFSLRLHWQPDDFKKIAVGLESKIEDAFKGGQRLALPQGKTVGAFLRFLIASQIRDRGFGAKGVISIDDDSNDLDVDRCLLKIGQFDALS